MSLRHAHPSALLFLAATVLAHGGEHGLQTENIDSSTSPCHDFFQYANGAWLRAAHIPPDRDTWGVDEEIDQRNRGILRNILENAASHPGDMSGEAAVPIRKIGDFYAAAME